MAANYACSILSVNHEKGERSDEEDVIEAAYLSPPLPP